MFLLSASPQEFVDLVATVHRPSPLDLELTSSSGLSWIVSARHQPEDYETETSGVGVKRKDTRSPYSYVLQGSCVLRCCCGQVRFPVVCRFRCLQCFFPNRGCGRMHSNHQCNPAHSTLHAQKRSWTAVCQGYNSPRYGPRTTIHEKQCRKKHLAVCVLLCWQSVLRTQRMDICVLKCRSSVLHPAVVRVKDYLDSEPQWYEEKAKSYDRDPLATLLSSPQTEIGKLRMALALLRLITWEYALAYQRRVDGRSGAEVDAGKECAPTARLKIFFSSFRAHMTAREQRRVLVRQNAVREVSPKWVRKMSHKLLNQNRRNAEIRVTGRPVCSSQNFSCLSRTWRPKHHLLRVNVKRADWNTWYIDISLFFSCKSI